MAKDERPTKEEADSVFGIGMWTCLTSFVLTLAVVWYWAIVGMDEDIATAWTVTIIAVFLFGVGTMITAATTPTKDDE